MKPVTSREYKLVLDASRFTGGETVLMTNAGMFWSELANVLSHSGIVVKGSLRRMIKAPFVQLYTYSINGGLHKHTTWS